MMLSKISWFASGKKFNYLSIPKAEGILSVKPHGTETGIRSGHVGLLGSCATLAE